MKKVTEEKKRLQEKWDALGSEFELKYPSTRRAKSSSSPSKQDHGMMGWMKSKGYNITDVPVPPGFFKMTMEERVAYIEKWHVW